jgi:NAD(P)-dependent dehydrogenase (short-subunit alcohol dehydrogenase family)
VDHRHAHRVGRDEILLGVIGEHTRGGGHAELVQGQVENRPVGLADPMICRQHDDVETARQVASRASNSPITSTIFVVKTPAKSRIKPANRRPSIAAHLTSLTTHGHITASNLADLPGVIDHVMVTGPGPYYAPLAELDRDRAHRDFDAHEWLAVTVAQNAVGRVRPGGTLLFMGGISSHTRGPGLSLSAAASAALPALIANLAAEVAPIRVNLIAAGFVDSPLSAELLGDDLGKRLDQLRAKLPTGRVIEVAALAVHIMINTVLTGVTYDIDSGQQLIG